MRLIKFSPFFNLLLDEKLWFSVHLPVDRKLWLPWSGLTEWVHSSCCLQENIGLLAYHLEDKALPIPCLFMLYVCVRFFVHVPDKAAWMCPRPLLTFYFGAPVLSWAVLQIQGLVWGGAPRRGSRLSLLLPLGRPRQQCMEKLIKTHAGRDPVDQAMRCHRKQAAWCWQSTFWLYNADLFSTQRKIVRSQSSVPQHSTFFSQQIF